MDTETTLNFLFEYIKKNLLKNIIEHLQIYCITYFKRLIYLIFSI